MELFVKMDLKYDNMINMKEYGVGGLSKTLDSDHFLVFFR